MKISVTNKSVVKESFLNMDVTSIAKAIKEGQTTSEEVVHIHIKHIKEVNPLLNAVVEERFSAALIEAKKMDDQLHSHSDNKLLYGVPMSIKESFNVKGMRTTGGLVHRQDLICIEDADVVVKLKAAGAIILGKTNTPTLCFCQETDNKLYGRTNNALDINRTAGGSSGGEGALLGVGGAVAGIGSDIGGSIRFPSHFNGVVGFKAGKFQVSSTGHFPADTIPIQKRMSGMGPMGKSVRDIELLYKAISDKTPTPKSLENNQIEILSDTTYPISDKTTSILDHIETFLSDFYATNRSIPPLFNESAGLWQEIMSVDGGKSIEKLAFTTDRSNVFTTYLNEMLTKQTDIHPYLSWALIGSNIFKPSKVRIKEIETILEQGDKKLSHYLNNKLLIFPVYHTAAPKHGKVYKEIFSIRKTFLKYMPYTAYANVWGLPALVIPIAADENNMPVGIQIMGSNGNEDAIFQLGKLLEEKFRGYIRSTIYDS